jgi:hypothetical protein
MTGKASGTMIQDGTVTAVQLGTNSVASDEIAADAVGASEIAADAVAVHSEPLREQWVGDARPRGGEQASVALLVLNALLVREPHHGLSR